MSHLVQVAVEKAVYHFDRLFTYALPEALEGRVAPGVRVLVPFGQGSAPRVGVIFALGEEEAPGLKEVSRVLDKEPVLSAEMLDLALWLKDRTYCTLFEAVKLMIPAGLHMRMKDSFVLAPGFKDFDRENYTPLAWQVLMALQKAGRAVGFEKLSREVGVTEDCPDFQGLLERGVVCKVNVAASRLKDATAKMVRLNPGFTGKLTPRQRDVYTTLEDVGEASEKELCYFTGASPAVVRALADKGAAEIFEYEVYRRPAFLGGEGETAEPAALSPGQQAALEGLIHAYEEAARLKDILFDDVLASGGTGRRLRQDLETSSQTLPETLSLDSARGHGPLDPFSPAGGEVAQRPQKQAAAPLPQSGALSRRKPRHCALLYGVTGSGKTSVYLQLIRHVLAQGRGAIVLVPEISLTAQAVRQFHSAFGDRVAVLHSGLSLGERMDEWKRIRRGEARVAVGTRSAVFAPVEDLGLIVIDEEQEPAYKSEASPRYDAREVARYRCMKNHGLCLLASATPSVEASFLAQQGKYGFFRLEERFGPGRIPEVELVDMNQEGLPGEGAAIGPTLARALQENFQAGRQSIVLLNRRGYHTFVTCPTCREAIRCPHCSISMTFHSANRRLMCHYCGYSIPMPEACPTCGGGGLQYRGLGTQRAEEQLQGLLPKARVLRLDTDAVAARYALERRLEEFAKGEYDVMVGTQMVAKGLDFENVTLVGVLSADQSLYSDDFRSNERTFDLLTQVVGRAGRGKYPGRAVVQTYMPENPVLHLSRDQDYFEFLRRELLYRKALLYPPFVDLLVVGFVGGQEGQVKEAAGRFLRLFSQLAAEEYSGLPLRVLRPSPAAVAKVGGKYRYKLIIKCRSTPPLRELAARSLTAFAALREFKAVTAYAAPDPDRIL